MSEVFTVEGDYNQAIEELKEAEKASDSVGDLILNQGIYKNLSDNYLAINNRELYKTYFEKYTQVQNQINEKEQKTINNSITNLIQENYLKTEKKLSKLRIGKSILCIALLLLFLLVGNILIKNYKKFKKIKKKLENFKP